MQDMSDLKEIEISCYNQEICQRKKAMQFDGWTDGWIEEIDKE